LNAASLLFAVVSLTIPFLHGLQPKNHYLHRLVIFFLTFSPVFIILTISYEGLFYFAFCVTLVTWVRLEYCVYKHTAAAAKEAPSSQISNGTTSALPRSKVANNGTTPRSLKLSDARTSLFFLAFIQSAFFSTGNIASVSSFSLDSVYRLIPVFNPFSQAALLILKLMIPFALISANLGVLNRLLGVGSSALFMVVMSLVDWGTMRFFWTVRDEGSWLEIGSSISHFCIASLLGVFVAILEAGSEVFVAGIEVGGHETAGQAVPPTEVADEQAKKRKSLNGAAAATAQVALAGLVANGSASVMTVASP
jgi:phosphatidylinositol glycan class N